MKRNIIYLTGALLSLASCSENAWNDHLDGYDKNQPTTVVKKVAYTLSNADYGTIAGLSENKIIAGKEDSLALVKLKSTMHFNSVITPEDYIPAFLASSKFEYYLLDNGSVVNVTYNIAEEEPAEISLLQGAEAYTVTNDDYIDAWGSDEDYIAAFTPTVKASKYIPGLLNAEGIGSDYAIVTYKYSDQEPIFQTVAPGEEKQPFKAMIVGGNYAAQEYSSTKGYGYLPSIEIDSNFSPVDASVDPATLVFDFTPTDGGYYIQDCRGYYLYQTGTYNSFNFSTDIPDDGAVWDVTDEQIFNTSVEKWIQKPETYSSFGSYNYANGASATPHTIGGKTAAPSRSAIVAVPTTTAFAIYKNKSDVWSEDTSIAVLQPTDYAKMNGSSNNYISEDNAAIYLPIYMNTTYPYGTKGDEKYVVYFTSSKGAIGVKQFVHDGTQWVINDFVKTAIMAFNKINGVWGASAGLVVFTHVKATELVSGETYIISTDGIIAKNLSKSYTYGYLKVTEAEYDNTHINLEDPSECEFTFTLTDKGWTIQDEIGRYYYMTGSYKSFNVSTDIPTSDDSGAYWDITINSDGTASITNKVKECTIQYDENYGSYGSYDEITHTLPSLFIGAGE